MLLLTTMDTMPRRRLFGLGLAATLAAGLTTGRVSPPVLADEDGEGTLAGRVVDANGGPLAQAVVTVMSAVLADGDATFTTGDDGGFVLAPTPAGLYDVAVELHGYQPWAVGALHVASGEAVRIEIVLEQRVPGERSY